MLLNHHPHTTSHLIVKTDNNKNNLKATIQNPLQSSRMTGTITATKSSSTPKPSTTATASTQAAQQKSVVMNNNNSNNKYGDKTIDPVGGAGKMVNGPTISFGSSATNTACLTKPPIQKAATVVASAAATANAAAAAAVTKTDNNKNVNIKNSQISSIKVDGDSKSDQSTNPTFNNLKRKLPLLNDINEMITCALCSGYFIDATTIVECLDTFCKSCIVNYLETSKSCPICDVPLSKIKPHQSLRHDKLKQSLVYKLAPQVFIDEMKRRREFYQKSPEAITSTEKETGSDATVSLEPFSKEDGGLVPIHSYYFRPNDKISMSLEYLDGPVIPNQQQQQPGINSKMNIGPSSATTAAVNKKPTRSSRTLANDNSKTKNRTNDVNGQNDENFIYIPPEDKPKRRYLLCPAALTILQLKKLLSNKFGEFETFSEFKIEIYYAGQLLKDDFTLMEVAYIYTWGANDPMRFSYCFVRKRPKTQLKAIENSIEEPSSSQQSLGRSLRPSSSSTSTSNHQNSTSNTTTTTTRSTSLTRGGSGGSGACQNNGSRNTNSSSSFSLNRSTSSSSSSSSAAAAASSAHHLPPGTSSSSGNSQKRIAITNPIQKVSVSNSSSIVSNNSRIIIQREYDNYHPGELAKKRPKLMDDDAEFTHTGTQTLTPSTNSSSSTSNGNSKNSVQSVPTTTTTVRITTTTTSSAGYSVRSSSASALSTKTSSALSSSSITVSRKRNGDFVAQPSLDHKNVHQQQHSIKRSASNNMNGTKEMNQPIALKTTTVSESTNKPTIIKLVQRPVTMVKDSAAATTAGSNKKEASSNHHHHHHHSSHHHHHHHSKDSNVGGQNQQQQKLSTSAYSVQNLINIDNNSNQNKKTTMVKGSQAINNTKSSSSPTISSSSINTSHSNGKDSGGSKTPSHPLSPPAIRIKLTTSPNSSPSQLIGQIISPIPPEVQNELKSVSAKSSESPKHKSSGSNSNSSINAPQGYKMVTSQGVQSSSTSANSSSAATTAASAAAAAATTATTSSTTTSTSTSSTTTSATNSKSGGRGKGIHDIINKMASQKSNFKSSCLKPFGSTTTGNGNVQPQADGQQPSQQQQQQPQQQQPQQQPQPQPQSQPHSPTSSSFEELINAKKSLDIEKTTSLTITTSKLIDSSTSAKEQSPQQQQQQPQQSTATKSSGNLVLRISRKPQTANPTSNSIDDSETFKSDCSNASGAAEIKQTKEKQITSPRLSCSSQLNLGDDDDDDDDDENSIEPKLVVDMDHDDDDDEDEDAIDSDDDDDETRTMLLIDDQCENDSGRGSSTSSEINAKISETSTPLGSKSGLMVQRSIASTASSKSSITSLDNSPLSVSAILTSTSPTISPRNSITLDVDTCKTVSAVKSSLISAPAIRPRGTFVAPLDLSSKKLSPSPPRSNSNKSGQSPSSQASSPGAVSPACSPTKLLVPTAKQQCSESTSSTSSSVGKSSQPLPSLGSIPWHMFPKRPKSLASKIVPPLPPSMMLPKISPVVSPPITVSLSNMFNNNNNSISNTSSSIVGNKSSQRSNKISNISVGSGINPIPQLISTSQATSSGTSCAPFVPGNFAFSPYDSLNSVMGMAAFMYNQHHPALKQARALSSNHRYNLLNRTNSSSLSLSSIPSNLLNVVNSASAGNTNNNNNLNTTSSSSNNLKRFMEREPQNRPMKCAIYSKNNTSRGGQSGSSSHNKNGNLFGSSSSSSSVMVSNNNNSTKSPTLINNRQQPKSSPSSSTAAAAAGSIPSSSSTSLQQQRNLSSSSSTASSSSSSTTSTQYQPVFPH